MWILRSAYALISAAIDEHDASITFDQQPNRRH